MSGLVIVSNRLPMSVRKVNGKLVFEQGLGGLATGLSGYIARTGTKWIGWPGIASDDLSKAEQAEIAQQLRKKHCYPVFLTAQQVRDYYTGYSNSVIWPLFHNLPLETPRARFWQSYRQVNQLFADETLRLCKPGSTIWVHDYQLMLVPQLLRRAGRDDKIGFFLHIPFPATSLLQTIPDAKRLLRGMLGADLVGFHTPSYGQDFLACCDALLGLSGHKQRVLVGSRPVSVAEFPMGIDYARFAAATQQPGKRGAMRELHRRYGNRKVIVTVDRLDLTKGLVERMRAYQQLLRQHPSFRGKVVMAMIVAPSRMDVVAHQRLGARLFKILDEIKVEFATPSWQPVDFIYRPVPLDEVMMLYRVADVAFIAPLIDGMNLVAKEFLASKQRGKGVLVLSETAGAAQELQDAILVNPKRLQTMVDGLARALDMPRRELRERARALQQQVQESTVQKWAGTFLRTLQQPVPLPRSFSSHAKTLGLAQQRLLLANYRRAAKRLLIFDYDGTLSPLRKRPEEAVPTDKVLQLLRYLGSEPKNDVLLISGRSRQDLQEWFGDLPIALAAEHGALFRRAGGKNWHKTSAHSDNKDWQTVVRDMFERYAALVPGAHVEQKEWALVWHYRTARPYAAQKNLVVLKRLLRPIARRYGLRIKEGSKVLEVHPNDINKGKTAQEWLIHDHDFVLAAGDDSTDEDTFTTLPASAYSIRVGRGRTAARFRVAGVAELLQLLGKL
ncbi:MAG TPA: bifunctional alpha,alpha-trehalose-phosphate synthase (UDP-forming)/trehalose-phosphatase [Candidatus Saccharimonadales bacterium]|nr:bifunctional alpha,alpha-trehalose-phosphate synthase (UDP-forming)/trehalose-phosphatase [Candidatus Saccharimonadales bacterium]